MGDPFPRRALGRTGLLVTPVCVGGGPLVRGFDGEGRLLYSFPAYDPNFRGGASVAVLPIGQVNANGDNLILTGPGPGGGPHVRTFVNAIAIPAPVGSWIVFDPAFIGGVFVG